MESTEGRKQAPDGSRGQQPAEIIDAIAQLADGADDGPSFCVAFDLGASARADGLVRALRLAHAEAVHEAIEERLQQSLDGLVSGLHVNGECYLVLLPDASEEQAIGLARRVLSAFEEPLACAGIRLPVRAAAGVMRFRPRGFPPLEVLRLALAAALEGHAEEGRLALREATGLANLRRSLAIVDALPEAFTSQDQLSLVYQPRLRLADGRCVRVEALLRWRQPALGPIGPAEFVPLVEELGLSAVMSRWVVTRALDQLAAWRRDGLDLGVSINIAAPNLQEEDFVDHLAAQLERHGMEPEAVELELTESIQREGNARVTRNLQALKQLGVALAIDDFGTAFSNLSDLLTMRAQVLKIDRSFIRDLATHERERAVVEAIVSLGHRLGYRIVAEGIETEAVLEMLTALGCDEGQGYHIARPMVPEDLAGWLAARAAG